MKQNELISALKPSLCYLRIRLKDIFLVHKILGSFEKPAPSLLNLVLACM